MVMSSSDDVRKQALLALTEQFVRQGHPENYAQHMATAVIFQTDLELRNAQLTGLLSWLQVDYPEVHTKALARLESLRQEFEQRIQQRS